MKQFLQGVFILFLFREAFFPDPLHQRNRPLTALHQVQHKEVSKHRVHWIRCFSDWWSGPVRSPCFGVYLRGTSKKHHTYVAIIPGCLRILASKAVPRGCNPDVCDPKIYSCNTTCWHGVSLQSSHIYRNIYIVEHILYSIYWDNKSDHKEIHHRDSAKNFTLNSTSNMRCNLTGDIAYVHVCKYMSLDPLDAPPPFNSGDWRLIGIPCLKMKSSNLVETVTGRRGTSQNTSTLSECPDHEMGHFWRQHDLSLSLGELPNNLGQPGELRWSLGSLRSQWPQESSLKVMPFPGKTIKKTISAKRDNPIYGVNWIVLWP